MPGAQDHQWDEKQWSIN